MIPFNKNKIIPTANITIKAVNNFEVLFIKTAFL